MRINSLTDRSRTRHFLLLALALAVTFAGFGSLASKSEASPVSLTFDNGRISMGFLDDKTVLPADSQFPSPDLPTPQRTDIQLNGDLTDGQISIPAATNTGLQFPYMNVMHPLEPDLKIPFTFRLNGDGLTGTWDEATGAMTLKGKLDIIVVTGQGSSFPVPDSLDDLAAPPLGLFARCRFDDVPVSFSTATQKPFTGQAFADGFGKNGALTTSWTSLTDAVSENGGDCADLNQITTSSGGIWLSNAVVKPKPQPSDPGPSCETDLSLCPTPKYTEIDQVRLRPGRKVVRPGQKLVLRVKVHNGGNKAAKGVKVRIRSSNRAFKVPKKLTLSVPKHGTATKKFTVRVKRNAKGHAQITAASNGWRGRAYLKIKPSK